MDNQDKRRAADPRAAPACVTSVECAHCHGTATPRVIGNGEVLIIAIDCDACGRWIYPAKDPRAAPDVVALLDQLFVLGGAQPATTEEQAGNCAEVRSIHAEILRRCKEDPRAAAVECAHISHNRDGDTYTCDACGVDDTLYCIRKQRDEAIAAKGKAEARVAELEAEVKRLAMVIERDRSAMHSAVFEALNDLQSRDWLTEGRGSYEWDDDRYQQEFTTAATSLREHLTRALTIAANLKDCPIPRPTWAEMMKALAEQPAPRGECDKCGGSGIAFGIAPGPIPCPDCAKGTGGDGGGE